MRKLFNSIFASSDTHDEKQQISKGLFIGKERDEGYWEVVHSKSGSMLMRSESKERAMNQAEYLDSLTDWHSYRELEELREENLPVFNKYKTFHRNHNIEKKYNGMYLKTLDSNGYVLYKYKTESGDIKVKGKLITPGLAIHEESDSTSKIIHIITGRTLSNVSSRTKGHLLGDLMKPLLDWSKTDIPQLIADTTSLKKYLTDTKYAIENGTTMPEVSEQLSLDLLYISNPKLKERRKIYETALKELHDMYGMEEIKEQVQNMMRQLIVSQQLKNAGIKEDKQTLHTIFYGPAGTGKTQVARVMAKLFYAMGYLDKFDIVETTADGLIGQYVGQTAVITQEKINEAMGGVLFIDEAYGFASKSMSGDKGSFGDDAIRVLLAAAENHRDRLCIILAGYENDMRQMMKMNEGLDSRFPKSNRFYFRDYTPKQLMLITTKMLREKNFIIEEEIEREIENCITIKSQNGAVNGNARWARNFKEEILTHHKYRVDKEKPNDVKTIVKETIQLAAGLRKKVKDAEGLEDVKKQALERIYDMVGLTDLKKNLEELMDYLEIQKMKFEQGMNTKRPNMHMIFAGPPGTGKTTVAEHVGQFLKGAGMLSNGHFIQIAATDLTKGNPSDAVEEITQKALGGVLFIDEAYSLCNDGNGKKAVDLLIQEMENNRDDLVVILAGYENEMKELLNMNPGFESRIVYSFDFPYYTAAEIVKMVEMELKKRNLVLKDEAHVYLTDRVQEIENEKGKIDGNGRWARNFVERLEIKQNSRIKRTGSVNLIDITKEDIENTFESLK